MSHYGDNDDDHDHVYNGRGGSNHRSWSPDHYSGGSGPRAPYAAGAMPSPSQFEPHAPFYAPYPPPPPNQRTLQVPYPPQHRPRSVPPPGSGTLLPRPRNTRRRDSYPSEPDSDSESHRPHSPLAKARHVLEQSFTSSTSGLGVGVLGAIVGGLAAREASEAAGKKGGSHHHSKDNKGALISTIVGAAVGGLGANAIEKRLELSRRKTKTEQEMWEKKWGRLEENSDRKGGDDRDSRDSRDSRELRDAEEGWGRRARRGSDYTSGEESDYEEERRRRAAAAARARSHEVRDRR